MVFFAGVVAGGAVGLLTGAVLPRRGGSSVVAGRNFATALAVAALVVASVALARSDRGSGGSAVAGNASPTTTAGAGATTTTGAAGATSTTTTTITGTQSSGPVTVPNVQTLSRADAVSTLERLGLKVSIETLPLANVPPGFVLTQAPLPGATTTAGALVTLEVSAPA